MSPIRDFVAAVSVGIVDRHLLLDLAYQEDSRAEVDMNVVMTGRGEFVELQGTAERRPFRTRDLQQMLRLATRAIEQLLTHQQRVLGARSVRAL